MTVVAAAAGSDKDAAATETRLTTAVQLAQEQIQTCDQTTAQYKAALKTIGTDDNDEDDVSTPNTLHIQFTKVRPLSLAPTRTILAPIRI